MSVGDGQPRTIVVGVDGSQPSTAALRWAASQAKLTGAALHVVTAWDYPALYSWSQAASDDIAGAAGWLGRCSVR